MKRSFLALTAVLVPFACTDSPTQPQPLAETTSLSLSLATGPPPTSGVVSRTTENTFLIVASDDGSLVAAGALGSLDPSQSVACGGTRPEGPITFQDIVTPSGAVVLLTNSKNITWHVWADAATFFSQASLCAALNLPRVAEGFGSLNTFDNDVFVSGTRTNSFGFMGGGTLDDLVNGGTTRLNVRLVLQEGKKGFRVIMEKVILH